MPMNIDEIVTQAMALPSESRGLLAEKLMESLEQDIDPKIEKLWVTEAKKRRNEVRTKEVDPIPGEDALAQVRRLIAK